MGFGFPPLTPGVRRVLLLLGGVFVAQLLVLTAMSFRPSAVASMLDWLALSLDGVLSGRVWQVATYMLLHSLDGWGHLLANAVGLYFLGTVVEQSIGRRRLYRLLIGAGLAGAVAVLLTQAVMLGLFDSRPVPVIGASGAISGVVGVFCWLHWDRWLSLFFIRLKGWHLLVLLIAVDLLQLLVPGGTRVSVECHAGGLIYGLATVTGMSGPRTLWSRLKLRWLRRKLRVLHGNDRDERPPFVH